MITQGRRQYTRFGSVHRLCGFGRRFQRRLLRYSGRIRSVCLGTLQPTKKSPEAINGGGEL